MKILMNIYLALVLGAIAVLCVIMFLVRFVKKEDWIADWEDFPDDEEHKDA